MVVLLYIYFPNIPRIQYKKCIQFKLADLLDWMPHRYFFLAPRGLLQYFGRFFCSILWSSCRLVKGNGNFGGVQSVFIILCWWNEALSWSMAVTLHKINRGGGGLLNNCNTPGGQQISIWDLIWIISTERERRERELVERGRERDSMCVFVVSKFL